MSASSVLGSPQTGLQPLPAPPTPVPPMTYLLSQAPCPCEYQAWALHVPFSRVVLRGGEFGLIEEGHVS